MTIAMLTQRRGASLKTIQNTKSTKTQGPVYGKRPDDRFQHSSVAVCMSQQASIADLTPPASLMARGSTSSSGSTRFRRT